MTTSPDLVVRGLPYEAQDKEIFDFFGLTEEQVRVSKWRDSNRCRGIAFITLEGNAEEIERVRAKDGETFEVDGKARQISITDYEERERRPRRQPRRNQDMNSTEDRPAPRRRQNNTRREKSNVEFEESTESKREIYVSNIPFEAREEDFQEVFGVFGDVEEVTIPVIYTSGKPKGFAFVRFATEEAREKAVNHENELTMHERPIGVRRNKGRSVRPQQRRPRVRKEGLSEKPEDCRTIFVGNLPWSTEEEDLGDLFKVFGKIVSCRIVKQSWSGRSRGFGYVEFEDAAVVDKAVHADFEVEGRKFRCDYAAQLAQTKEEQTEV